jgi:Altronate dehydratase
MVIINKRDNVGVMENGHKQALCDINNGENIIKYGYPIGHATEDIKKGETVHTHNMKTNLSGLSEYTYNPKLNNLPKGNGGTFMGYRRTDGQVGIRNEIWIIATVGCINKSCEILAKRGNEIYAGMTDGFYTFPHPCGCSQLGQDHETAQKTLAGLVKNPNAAGVLIVGLGCENNSVDEFKKVVGDYNPDRVKFMITQELEDEFEVGVQLLGELAEYVSQFKREPCDVSNLKIGLKCGGSDAFSGITANPAVGGFSDILISNGGSTVLTEVPEMFGAETILMDRCINEEIFNKTVDLINNYKKYYMRYNQPIYENPSLGNKAGGITTLEEKSLGCTQKGGTANVADVIAIGDQVKTQGLTLLDGPGNDIVASTGCTAAGCQMVLFTTGRGTPYGAPVPTMKIATNRKLANKKPHWIDFNADLDNADTAQLLYDFVIEVASGRLINNEIYGYREIAVFKDGITQ